MKQYIKLLGISPDHSKQLTEAAVNLIIIIATGSISGSILSSLQSPKYYPILQRQKLGAENQVTHSKVLLRIGSTDNSQLAARMHGNYSCDPRGNV